MKRTFNLILGLLIFLCLSSSGVLAANEGITGVTISPDTDQTAPINGDSIIFRASILGTSNDFYSFGWDIKVLSPAGGNLRDLTIGDTSIDGTVFGVIGKQPCSLELSAYLYENPSLKSKTVRVTFTDGQATQPSQPATPDGATAIYRAYNPNTGEHLFAQLEEIQNVANQGWRNEGFAWNSPNTGDGVYRIYNPNHPGGDHHYTSNLNEAINLQNLGWKIDNSGNPVFYSGGSIPVYRCYNPNDSRHHFTRDLNEYESLGNAGWRKEDIAFNSL